VSLASEEQWMLLANSHEEACWAEGWALFNGESPIPDYGL